MLKILFALNTIVIIIALIFLGMGIRYFKNDERNIKGFKYIIESTKVMGVCIILSAMLFSPVFFES